jgi:hypothetical protein
MQVKRHASYNLTEAIRRLDLARRVAMHRRKLLRINERETHDETEWSVCFYDALMLGIEAQRVIRLRLAAIAEGGTTVVPEMRLMVVEKILALSEAARMFAGGKSVRAVLRFYRSKVQANERRLTAGTKRWLSDRARQKLHSIPVLSIAASTPSECRPIVADMP